MKTKETISFEEFLDIESKLDIRIGIINGAERIPKSYGLELVVQFEDEDGDNYTKTAFTNLGKDMEPEDLIGLQCPFIVNLEPSVIKGVTSEVMIMATEHFEKGTMVNPHDYHYGAKLL